MADAFGEIQKMGYLKVRRKEEKVCYAAIQNIG